MQQQTHKTEEVVRIEFEKETIRRAHDCGVNPAELDSLLGPIMESCTKESISQGKAWILHYTSQPHASTDAVAQYLLYKTIQSGRITQKLLQRFP